MGVRIFIVDAFTEAPFLGNPAAVCILEKEASSPWMQAIAAEMNLSETAFVVPQEERFGLRWFTPAAEVDLCGHATLASAHILWQTGRRRAWPIEFETRSGSLVASVATMGVRLDFPADPPKAAEVPPGLSEILGSDLEFFGVGRDFMFGVMADEAAVRGLVPDFRRMATIVPLGLSVSARSSDRTYDFVSRFFAPAVGVDEDPVTGSAHCLLGPFWGRKLDKERLVGFQASRRGGVVRVQNAGDRTFLEGGAVTVMSGELLVDPE